MTPQMTASIGDVTTPVTLNIQAKDLLYRIKQNFCFKSLFVIFPKEPSEHQLRLL
ncbi:hypothetical protein [Bartonella saheliensis]|uniref:hypothetical protein n=1 Tax=Bartonella saheliensis TaxID=1457016 RepID=UPI00140BB374|nr:hypothetical protein [Bartonella saheliensis]